MVAFLGPVGVGKSTVMLYLAEVLRIRGQRVHVDVLKSFHGISYALWFFIARILGLRSGGRYAPWLLLIRGGRSRIAKLLLNLTLYFDAYFFIPAKLLLLRLLKRLGFVVLVEEYAYTSILDYLYTSKQMLNMRSLPQTPLKIVLSLLARYEPDAVIILMADTRELVRRWRKRGYGEPQQHYLKLSIHYCINMVKHPRKIVIDSANLDEYKTLGLIYKSIIRIMEKKEIK